MVRSFYVLKWLTYALNNFVHRQGILADGLHAKLYQEI